MLKMSTHPSGKSAEKWSNGRIGPVVAAVVLIVIVIAI